MTNSRMTVSLSEQILVMLVTWTVIYNATSSVRKVIKQLDLSIDHKRWLDNDQALYERKPHMQKLFDQVRLVT